MVRFVDEEIGRRVRGGGCATVVVAIDFLDGERALFLDMYTVVYLFRKLPLPILHPLVYLLVTP